MLSPNNSSSRLLRKIKTLLLLLALAAFFGSASAANNIGRIDAVAEIEGVGADPNPVKKVVFASPATQHEAPVIDRRNYRNLKAEDDPSVWQAKAAKSASGDFLEFAMKTLEDINEQICKQDEDTCDQISQLVAAGEKYKVLPLRIYVNFRAMAIAYPTVFQNSPFFLEALRVHRALGLGNAQLFQGYSENVVNELYWSHYNRLAILDKDIQPLGDGIETYCDYIANEYQALKDFAVANYGGTVFANVPTFGQNQMRPWCLGLDGSPSVSFIVRNDWEHHRAEVVGSMMSQVYTETMVTHTILHWESLFSALAAPDVTIPLLFESFDVFLQE
jgi:hypothetical protein